LANIPGRPAEFCGPKRATCSSFSTGAPGGHRQSKHRCQHCRDKSVHCHTMRLLQMTAAHYCLLHHELSMTMISHQAFQQRLQIFAMTLICFSAIDAAFGQAEQWDQYTDAAYDKLGKKLLARKDIEESQRLDSANS